MTDCNTKICTNCGEKYPATTEFFRKKKGGWLGLEAQCKKCRNEKATHYPSSHSDKRKQTKSIHAKRPDVAERRRTRRRERYNNDPEYRQRVLDDNTKRQLVNPEITRLKKRDEYQRHKDKYRERGRKHYLQNRNIYIERARNYKSDPVAHGIRTQRRLARKRQLPDTFTKKEWLRCLDYFNNQCAVCGKPFSAVSKPYMDHWIPLNSDQCPGTVAENMVCLCGGKGGCNESKHNRKAELWLLDFYTLEDAAQILDRVTAYFEQVRSHHVR